MKRKFRIHWTQSLRHPWVKSLLLLFAFTLTAFLRGDLFAHTDILWLTALLGWLFFQRRACFLLWRAHDFTAQRGIFAPERTTFLHRKRTEAELSRSPLLRLTGGVRLHLSTFGGELWRDGVTLARRDGEALRRRLIPPLEEDVSCRPARWALWLTAGAQSNAFAGLILILPLFRQSLTMLQDRVLAWTARLPEPLRTVIAGLPAAWIFFAWIIGIGWAAAFLRELEEMANSRVFWGKNCAGLRCGVLTRQLRVVFPAECGGVFLQQTGIMLFFRLYSVWAVTGQKRSVRMLPAASEAQAFRWLAHIFPKEGAHWRSSPPAFARKRYGRPELLWSLPVLIGFFIAGHFKLPMIQGGLGIVFLLLAARAFLLKYTFARVSILVCHHTVTVRRCVGLSFRVDVLMRDQIAIRLKQHPLQQRKKLCTIEIFAPGHPPAAVKHLTLRDGLRLMRILTE